jgi:hypothetical protein
MRSPQPDEQQVDEFAFVADASIGIGLVGAVGAAVTGVTDWQDAHAPARRLGLIHGLLNIGATSLAAIQALAAETSSDS